jgi:S-DNA-T family DNA segregation ATPase FtsK/SpoIIIE
MFGFKRRRNNAKKTTAPRRSSRKKSTFGFQLSIQAQVARDIWAIIWGVFSIVMILSLKGSFGVVGDFFVGLIQPIIGWGIYMIPVVFGLISLMLFFSRTVNFGFARVLGVTTLMVSILSILHLSVPIPDLLTLAQDGQYGGYTGFVMNFFFRELLKVGYVGASVVFLGTFFIGLLLTFDISLRQLFGLFEGSVALKRVRVNGKDADEDEEDEEELQPQEMPMVTIRRAMIGNDDAQDELSSQDARAVPVEVDVDLDEEKEVEEDVSDHEVDEKDAHDPDMPEVAWEFPSLDLLSPPAKAVSIDSDYLMENAEKIRNKLKQFGIEVSMHEVNVGPTVIQYTLRPDEGVKLSKILTLKNDVALALAAKAVRIEAPIPGKSLVGIEIPNENRVNVGLREILESKEFAAVDSNLRLPLGRDVSGRPMVGDLASMPHLLIAGSTGAGKSVGMNAFLVSLLYQNSPSDLKMIMVDPKRVELTFYNGIPHLLTPVITDPEKAAIALRWCVAEMTRRYQILADARHRNIADYNEDPAVEHKMPRMVIVIDELADLMLAAKGEVEASICRIAQMARAVGMHLIVATQRPSVDVITGLIKANIPSRIAYAVSSSIDSRTILDGIGAEDLLGRGDMLYLPVGMNKPQRIQGVYLSTSEIERITNNIKVNSEPQYLDEVTSRKVANEKIQGVPESVFAEDAEEMDDDTLVQEALKLVLESRKASASLLQRRLKVGYARAARLLDIMEERGWIGPSQGAKARDIYYQEGNS